jgi:glycosyltransferase involved in cell wall biosynthesis
MSGLTETARVLAEGLAQRGLRVAVVALQHDRSLPRREHVGGVDVLRCRTLARASKAMVSPELPLLVARMATRARALHLHLPMPEAGVIATLVGGRRPLLTTYQCDVALGGSLVGSAAMRLMDASSRVALRRSARVVVSSQDYAHASRIATSLAARKAVAIPPPCRDRSGGAPTFRDGPGRHVGFLGRIVEEKGVEFLVSGFRKLADPEARLLLAGDHLNVAGGSVIDRVRAAAKGDPRIRILGFVPEERLADFYASLDVFAFPSVNSLEAFGIAQVEAMLAGVPVIASDLPGVRTPVRDTGFGVLVPPADADAIHRAISEVARDRFAPAAAARVSSIYSTQSTIDRYAALFADMGVTASGQPRGSPEGDAGHHH